jgi:hypothetical protein
MDRRDDRVGRRRQEAVNLMRPKDRLGLRAAISVERRSDASERKQPPTLVERANHTMSLCRATAPTLSNACNFIKIKFS